MTTKALALIAITGWLAVAILAGLIVLVANAGETDQPPATCTSTVTFIETSRIERVTCR